MKLRLANTWYWGCVHFFLCLVFLEFMFIWSAGIALHTAGIFNECKVTKDLICYQVANAYQVGFFASCISFIILNITFKNLGNLREKYKVTKDAGKD